MTDETQGEVFILFYVLTTVPRGWPGPPNFEVRRRVIRAPSTARRLYYFGLARERRVYRPAGFGARARSCIGTFFNEFCELDRRHCRRLWPTDENAYTVSTF